MSLALLLDLDDTLLENDMNVFLPGYLQALSSHLSKYITPARLTSQLLASTGKMVDNQDAAHTLEEVFNADFYPALGISLDELREPLFSFYEDVFPKLAYLTRPRPQAVELVATAFKRGWQVIVATNPLFPRRAIEHRLAWAGLPLDRYPFTLITAYENMHFAKPNPAYFAEILGRLAWPAGPVAVVGNSLSDDIQPAAALGIPVFWLDDSSDPLPPDLHPQSAKGDLSQALAWLEKVEDAGEELRLLSTPASLLATFISTPAIFDWLLRNSHPATWSSQPRPGEWCFTEIMCHLRDSDLEINLPRLDRIFTEKNTFIAAVNADEWSATRGYCAEDAPAALAGLVEARTRLVNRLRALKPADWMHPARHAIFGPTTLQELAGFIATHDRTHVQQAYQTLAQVAAPTDH